MNLCLCAHPHEDHIMGTQGSQCWCGCPYFRENGYERVVHAPSPGPRKIKVECRSTPVKVKVTVWKTREGS